MLLLPPEFSEIMSVFSSVFTRKIYRRALLLSLGSILTQGKRTICSVLRTLGLSQTLRWDKYHRVLSRCQWSALSCSKLLADLIIARLYPREGVLVFGIDETIERRWGGQISARGIYRDAVRSSKSHFVKCSGLRWLSVMLLCPIEWSGRVWALPFLTLLAPSKRYYEQQDKVHKTLGKWAYQISLLLHRWFAHRTCVVVADGSYAIMELLSEAGKYQTWIVGFRKDAALYDLPPVYAEGEKRPVGRPPMKGQRQASLNERLEDKNTVWTEVTFSEWYGQKDKKMLITTGVSVWYRAAQPAVTLRWVLLKDPQGKLEPKALACTNVEMDEQKIVQYFAQRWGVEVTFEEVRAHLGVETQRQWADLSIARTTPVLMALFSIVTLWADTLNQQGKLYSFPTAWYQKQMPTFSDALHSVRIRAWNYQFNLRSVKNTDCQNIKTLIFKHLAFMAARAA